MATKVLVPRLGEGVEELTIIKWLKKEGDLVKDLEPFVEVETDKVVTEIPSPVEGMVLKILIAENSPASVGEVMAWIGKEGENLDGENSQKPIEPEVLTDSSDQPGEKTVHTSPVISDPSLGFLSPVVRKIASEKNVDLRKVTGSGLNGRITKQDLIDYLTKGEVNIEDLPHQKTKIRASLYPVSTIRRQIAERMQKSKQISPHVMTVMEADMSSVVIHRMTQKDTFAKNGVNLTYTAYFITAIVAGLKAYPLVNSSWTEKGILLHPDINLGMATSLGDDGLIVPVIHKADDLSLFDIARAINDLSNRARSKKLRPEEVRDGTFTLTNHGKGGSLFAMPIINQPQCGILGVGVIQKRAVVVIDKSGSDAIAIRPLVYLSFVFDHRILDGASADAFLFKVKQTLEVWFD